MRPLALTLLLTGCPATEPRIHTADCCRPADAGEPCEWEPYRYQVPALTDPIASDDRACRQAGLEPYRGAE